jgi:hypothetical protein
LRAQATLGDLARQELAYRREWDDKRTSALWAWNARATEPQTEAPK